MLTRRKTITLSAAGLGVLAAGAVAWGANESDGAEAGDIGGRHWGAHRGRPLDRMARHLDLSDEQRSQIEAIFANTRTESARLRSELETLREDMGAMIRSEAFFAEQVRMEVESKAPVFVELTVLGVTTMNDVYKVLTPEQRAKADEMLARRRGRGFGRGFGMGGFF
jgi:protein CpxP